MKGSPRLLVCTEAFPPQTPGSSLVVRHLLAATTSAVEYLVATAVPGRSSPGIAVAASDLPAFLYRRDLRVGLSDVLRLLARPLQERAFLAAARAFRPEAVLSIFPSDRFAMLGHRLARALGVPHAIHFHNLWGETLRFAAGRGGCAADRLRARLAASWEETVVRGCRARFALTEAMARFLSEKHRAPFTCLPHAFPPAPPVPPAPAGGLPGRLDLLLPGSVYGMHIASLRVLMSVLARRRDVRLTVTTGQSRAYLASIGVRETEDLTLAHYPNEEAFFRRVAQADGCVVCLSAEGHDPDDAATALPTRAVEALRFGKPLLAVAPRGSCLEALVRDHAVGIAAPPDEPERVAAAVEEFTDGGRRETLGRNGRRLFDERFSTERVGPAWIEEVRRLVRPPG